jgi:hypothetical protein
MKILKVNELSTLSIIVSEQIESKNLHNFLRTSIKNHNLTTLKDSSYSFFYNPKNFTYEIIVYETLSTNTIAEPFVFMHSFISDDDRIKVLLCDNYFIIIQNNKLLILKKVNKIIKEEISLYIEQVYKINDFEIIEMKSDFYSKIKVKEGDIKMDSVYPLYNKKSFYIFILFTVMMFLGLVISLYISSVKFNHNVIKSVNAKTIPIIDYSYSLTHVVILFNSITLKNIQLKKVIYFNNQFQTTLLHKNKEYLLEFINTYKKNIYLKSLKYDAINDIYSLDISIEY